MATDEKDPDSNADGDGREPFVDRDDDSSSSFVDRDVDDADMLSMDDAEDADPGYAAFAGELEDPLADWPSPDAPLDALPEMRGANGPHRNRQEHATISDDRAEQPREYESYADDEAEDISPASASDDMLFADDNSTPDSLTPDAVDSDHPTAPPLPATNETMAQPRATGIPVSAPDNVPEPPSAAGTMSDSVSKSIPGSISESVSEPMSHPPADREDPVYDRDTLPKDAEEQYFEELHFEDEATDTPDEDDYDEEFVDDFLNDLDPPAADDDAQSAPVDEFGDKEDSLFDEPSPLAAAAAASTVEKMTTSSAKRNADQEPPRARRPATGGPGDTPERALPVGMIVVVIIALVLLGIGGYGVVQQRAEMESEIRDLQARLATAVSPEEAEAERELQRQVQLENESLGTELEALTAENSALAEQLAELTAALEEKEAAAIAAAEQKAAQLRQAQAEQSAAKAKPRATASNPAATAVTGRWFVNFGSYAERPLADRWAARLSVDDGKVVVQTASAAGKTLYRVRVIDLGDQDAAERVATALERQYQLPRVWVGKN
jgi:hypothetical protein